jgi:hypothetical protein
MIPRNITRDDVIKAANRIKETGVPPEHESREYHLIFGDGLFPPKYVISVANEFANGEELPSSKFTATEARTFLSKLGFKIVQGVEPLEIVRDEEMAIEATISLERDLEEYIVRNLDQIEDGLKLYSKEDATGRQIDTDVGRIDILAIDKNNDFVVIELKAGMATYSVIGQILAYISWIRRDIAGSKKVRGMIIADDFDKKLRYASSETPNISLKKYEVNFTFKDV